MTKSERITQFAVVVIAVCAVAVSVWQGQLSRQHLDLAQESTRIAQENIRVAQEHNKLSVRPYLDFFSGWESDNKWSLTLSNEGIGPSIIKSIEYTFEGKTYTDWDAVLDASGLRKYRMGSINIGADSPFATDKVVTLLSLRRAEGQFSGGLGINILIKYESIYKEPFELKIKL